MGEKLTDMVRPKEIQDLVPWKVGTLTDRGVIISIASLESDDILFLRPPDKFEFTKRRPKDLIKIPTLEDVGRGLEDFDYDTAKRGLRYIIVGKNIEADTELKARIKLFMWVAHGKTWHKDKFWEKHELRSGELNREPCDNV